MNSTLTILLINKYPRLYRGVDKPIKISLMPFGFECGDGWYRIIDKASRIISKVDPDAEMVQVKEKFGGLRMYLDGNNRALDIANIAESMSYTVCENCGKPGSVRQGRWVQTLCDGCAEG